MTATAVLPIMRPDPHQIALQSPRTCQLAHLPYITTNPSSSPKPSSGGEGVVESNERVEVETKPIALPQEKWTGKAMLCGHLVARRQQQRRLLRPQWA